MLAKKTRSKRDPILQQLAVNALAPSIGGFYPRQLRGLRAAPPDDFYPPIRYIS